MDYPNFIGICSLSFVSVSDILISVTSFFFLFMIGYHYFFCIAVALEKKINLRQKYSFGNWNRLTLIFTPFWACISITFHPFPIPAVPFLFLSLSPTVVIFFKKLSLTVFWLFSLCVCTSLQWCHRHPSCRLFFHTLCLPS